MVTKGSPLPRTTEGGKWEILLIGLLMVILLGGGDGGDVIAVASAITVGDRQIFLEVLPNA